MKLWLLRNIDNLPPGTDDPWAPWYDKAFGFVVRAESDADARTLASEKAGDENPDFRSTKGSPWLDPNLSTCEELTADGPAVVVMVDFHAA